jgi:3-oxoacyl-[acyl-carrier-protein] synthase III
MSSNNNNNSDHLTPQEKTELLNLIHAEAKKLIRARGEMITTEEAVNNVLKDAPKEFEKAIDELATTNSVLAEKLSRHHKHQPSIIVEEIDLEAAALVQQIMNTDPGLRKWKQDNPELAKDSEWMIKVWKRKGLLD